MYAFNSSSQVSNPDQETQWNAPCVNTVADCQHLHEVPCCNGSIVGCEASNTQFKKHLSMYLRRLPTLGSGRPAETGKSQMLHSLKIILLVLAWASKPCTSRIITPYRPSKLNNHPKSVAALIFSQKGRKGYIDAKYYANLEGWIMSVLKSQPPVTQQN